MTLAQDRKMEWAEAGQAPVLTAYAGDPYTWALEQADLLRSGRIDLVDAAGLADEITALAHYLADNLRSDLSRVLQHLLKWDHQPQVRTRSWALSIEEHRRCVARHLKKAPGLKFRLHELLAEAYEDGRMQALKQTRLPKRELPETCPYTWDEIMTRPIDWPETL